jgi:tetratricopeptide (TPR) repeat protein
MVFLLFFFADEGNAGEKGRAERTIDEALQMELADHFFKQEDYYRAITEYKRFLFFFPQSSKIEDASWKIAQSYFKGQKWDEAISAADQMIQKFPNSARLPELYLLQGLCFAEKKNYPRARSYFEKAKDSSADFQMRQEAQWQIAMTYRKEERWKEAVKELRAIDPGSPLYPRSERWARGLDRMDLIPQKSPVTAGILAILPGAGHLYCERYRDATIAFLLNGAFIWGMVEAFQNESYVVGGILTFFELGWYSGNIYSAVSSAHKYNRKKKQEYLNNLEKEVRISTGMVWHGKTPIFTLRFSF